MRNIQPIQKTVLGYELIAASDNAEGTREEDVIHVYYTYKLKDSTVVVNYVDINGKEIAESETLNGKVFEEYKTEAKQINGYQLTMLREMLMVHLLKISRL